MNYIELINNFWQVNKEHCFTGNETALYFYLLHTCNSLGWKNPFKHSNGHITGMLGMSEKTLNNSRNRLSQSGLIEFKSGNGRRDLSSYTIKGVKIPCFREQTGLPLGSSSGTLPGENTPDNIKPNETKLKKGVVDAAASPPPEKESLVEELPAAQQKNEEEKSCAKKEETPPLAPFVPDPHEASKTKYLNSVRLTRQEHQSLVSSHGEEKADWMIAKLDAHKMAKGATYQSDYHAILNWVVDRARKEFKPKNSHASNQKIYTRQPSGESLSEIEARYR